MKKVVFLLMIVLSLSGCSLFRKTMTVTKTEVRFLYDTILKVNVDGYKPMIDIRPVGDTAKVVSKTGTSIAYVDPITSKINLTFTPNDFDVKIKIDATKVEKKRDIVYVKPFIRSLNIIFIFAACITIWYGIYYTYRKITKL